jgi:hypothetical protein
MSIEKVSTLVRNQFPDFYKEDGENFLAFVQAYYEWMETEGQMTDAIRNFESWRDISTTTDEFIDYFFRTLLPSVPVEVLADKKLMAKYIKQFNQSRGTLASYKLLFRTVFNEDVELNYPADQILKVSDGDWRIDRYLVTSYDHANYDLIGKTVKGTESGAEALVEDVVTRIIRGRHLMQILLSNIKGTFNHFEPIRLKGDVSGSGHAPVMEAGISKVTILTSGGEYQPGDIVELISDKVGRFAKVVITKTVDLGGALSFSLLDGGSGYGASTDETVWGDTDIDLIGGDGTTPASFTVERTDLRDMFALSVNTNLIGGSNMFFEQGPAVTQADGSTLTASTFANTVLSQTDFGFPELGDETGIDRPYRDHSNAVIVIANTSNPGISVGDSLFGVTSGANATVNAIARAYNSTDVVLRVNGFKDWVPSEKVNLSTSTGTTIGTVAGSGWYGNTIGYHVISVGEISGHTFLAGQEIVGRTSGAYGVVKKVVSRVNNGYNTGTTLRDYVTMQVTANTSANLTSQFTTGPMKSFIENEGLRLVGANTTVGNSDVTTSNTKIENVYTKLSDSLLFSATYFGSIGRLSSIQGGSGYTKAPKVEVRAGDIVSLGIGEAYLTLQSDDINWSTGNSAFTRLDTNDRIIQSNTGASGDVKGGYLTSGVQTPIQHANGTYEMVVRVWQDFNQREPNNINWANNAGVTFNIYDSSVVPGEADNRSVADTGEAKIVSILDRGVLGKNAVVVSGVGSNGTITGLRVIDSGFSYEQNEVVTIAPTTRNLAVAGSGQITLSGAANAEGYYASSRSQISTKRGYIQDSYFYQEFSYELLSPISLNRYRDIALKLCHPAGQALFGRYRAVSNAALTVTANTSKTTMAVSNGTFSLTKPKASGTIAITPASNTVNITGTSTAFDDQFANGDFIIIETDPGAGKDNLFWLTELNVVSNATTANLANEWLGGAITSANVYYANTGTAHTLVGSSSTLTSEYVDGDELLIEVDYKQYQRIVLNSVNSATSANLDSLWVGPDFSGANAHYITGSF